MKIDTTAPFSLRKDKIPYTETGFFSQFVAHYLSENERLTPFYGRRPNPESFGAQMDEKTKNYTHREALVDALQKQYQTAKLKSPALDLLKSDKTFTITTGHQVCLFTGPLYFFYKIVTAINTCKRLKEEYPNNDFIPVYWMASEDHDFEEANHFFLPSGKIEWESGQGGAVGRMGTQGMDQVVEVLESKLGIGYRSGALIDLFKKAYLEHANIADATRYLVDQIFGKFGVLVIDGDDAALKKLAIPAFERELKEQISNTALSQTNRLLIDKGYNLQIKPQPINLFYLDDQLRERIEREADGNFRIAHTNQTFTPDELIGQLHSNPEKFSPNVALRPLYQEIILPNLAYIGGGGELAYWFQLKDVFDSFDVTFPILMLRNSVMIVDRATSEKMEKLGIDCRAVFRQEHVLEDELVRRATTESLELDRERNRLEKLFLDIEERLRKIDPNLEKSVRSGYVRSDRVLHNLEKKMMRAERKKQDIVIGRLTSVREALFPRGGLQERNMNFTPFYLAFGEMFVESLIEKIDPFDFTFSVLTEA